MSTLAADFLPLLAKYWMVVAIIAAIAFNFYKKGRRPSITELIEVLSLSAGLLVGLAGYHGSQNMNVTDNMIYCIQFGAVILVVASGYGIYDLLNKPDIFIPTTVTTTPPRKPARHRRRQT
ncbi:MAG: hypothetical protein AAB403_02850 [Planctomycetota bacterium]